MAQTSIQDIVINTVPDSYDPKEDTKWYLKRELINDIKQVVGNKTEGNRPLNIVVLGCPGSGKSSFLNTVFTSLRTDCWRERARVGSYGGYGGQQVTKHLLSFRGDTNYYKEEPDIALPTFIDLQGLQDADNRLNRELISGLLNGKVKHEQCMIEIETIVMKKSFKGLKRAFDKQSEYLKVDRIIVVVSAENNTPLPSQLLKCIHDISHNKRDIPMFCVMTKEDLCGSLNHLTKRKEQIKNILGITDDRLLSLRNYCPDIDQHVPKRYHSSVFPFIDVPVLDFIKQVVNPELEVINSKEDLSISEWQDFIKAQFVHPGNYVIPQVFLLLILVFWLSWPQIPDISLNELCSCYDTYKNKDHPVSYQTTQICQNKLSVTTFPYKRVLLFLVFMIYGIPFLDRVCQRYVQSQETQLKLYAAAVVVLVMALLIPWG